MHANVARYCVTYLLNRPSDLNGLLYHQFIRYKVVCCVVH